jgi:ligand-binding sensor domain-containing protein/signal transduction histidine kinase
LIHRFLHYCLICFGFIVSLSTALAQPVEFEHINRSHGLPNNTVTSIVQDKYGMMWFGTMNGLVRYDGYDFKVFVSHPNDTNTLSDNFISYLSLTQDGKIIAITQNYGFSIFDQLTETFKQYTHNPDDENSLSDNRVMASYADGKGHLWLGTMNGLNLFDPRTNKFEHFPVKSNSPTIEKHDFVSAIIGDKDGKLLLYTSASRLVSFNPKSGTYDFIRFPHLPKATLRLHRGGVLYRDNRGFLWVGTEFNGLFRMNEKTGEVKSYTTTNGKLTSDVLLCVKQDRRGRLWVATDGGGLLLYNYVSDTFTPFMYDPENPHSINSNAIYDICEDKNGHLWIGAYASGINVIKNNKRKFESYTNKGKQGKKLSYKSVLAFAKADKGKVWIGTDGGGLNLFDHKTKTFSYFNKSNSGICSDIVKSLHSDSEGNLWVGTYASGLCKVNFEKKKYENFLPFDTRKGMKMSHINVWALAEDRRKEMWVGLLDCGLDRYSPQRKEFQNYTYDKKNEFGLTAGNVLSLKVDKNDHVWVGTETGGLCVLDHKRDKFVSYKVDTTNKESLKSNCIHTVFEDSDGKIWVGTKQGGLSVLVNRNQKRFQTYTKQDGLPSNTICAIQEDTQKNLWISTDHGLCKFDKLNSTFKSFDVADGLQSQEFNMGASHKDANGYLYFGGVDGFNRFFPDSIKLNTFIPNVYITNIKVFNKNLELRESYQGRSYFNKPVQFLDTLTLRHSDYVFSIQFTATDYTSPEKNQFAYRLLGMEEEWNYVDATKRVATYSHLPAGIYTFQVRASNNDGYWNERGKELVILMLPPWWETWWFKMTVAAFLIFGVILFYNMRLSSIRNKNMLLSKLVKYRTEELESVNDKLQQQNQETIRANKQLESQNEEILKKSKQILLQQSELTKSRDELTVKNLELKDLNANKDKLFSIIGHDLRNPVAALSALTEMLQGNYQHLDDKGRLEIVKHIQSSSQSLNYLVNNLLDWALVQSKHLNPIRKQVEVRKLANDCIKVLSLGALTKGVALQNTCEEGVQVVADPHMLETILRNLIGNAIKFTPREGKVVVSTKTEQSNIVITIEDTGVGMSQEKKNQLLSSKQGGSTAGTSNEKGSGLGMVIVKEFVEASGGRLEIESTLDKGTTFKVFLPIIAD